MFHFIVEADGVHTPRETVLIIVNVLNNTLFRREHLISSFFLSLSKYPSSRIISIVQSSPLM